MSLLQSHPVLVVLRDIIAWWDLGDAVAVGVLEADPVGAALAAWIADDRGNGDDPGAAAHEAFARDVARALEIGVPEAFAERSALRESTAPTAFRDGLRRVDDQVLEHLRSGHANALESAAATLDELIRTGPIDEAEPLFQLALFSDAARLFDAVLADTQDDEMLRRVIACCDVVVQLRRDWDQHPAGSLLNLDPRLQDMTALLGARLGVRFARTGDPEDLTRAIRMAEAGFQLTSPSAPDLPLRLRGHAQVLGFRRDESSLAIATGLLAEARDLEPRSSPLWAAMTMQYGSGLVELARFERFHDVLDTGIAALREAQRESGTSSDPALSFRLGRALLLRHERSGDGQALDDATDLLAEVVGDAGGPLQSGDQRLEALYDAVQGLATRYGATPERASLERTLRTLLVALRATATLASGPAEWLEQQLDALLAEGTDAPVTIAASASAFLELYSQTTAEVYLEAALRLLRVASAAESVSGQRSRHHLELSRALALRYGRNGREPDLDEAIALAAAAVEAASAAGDRDIEATARNAHGSFLGSRFERNGNTDDLEAAIAEVERAVADPELLEPEAQAGFLANLGALIRHRAAHLRQPGDEQRAVDVLVQAVTIADEQGTANLRGCLHNLASARETLYVRTHRRRDFDDAIADWRRAVDLEKRPEPATRHGLARALLDRFEMAGRKAPSEELDEAIQLLEQALADSGERSPNRPACGSTLARALELRARRAGDDADVLRARELNRAACELGLDVAVQSTFETGYSWGERATTRRAWDEAIEAYVYGVRALQRLVGPQALRAGKLAWLRRASGLAVNAAYAFAKSGDPDAAAIALEGTRGLLIAEARGPELFRLEQLEAGPYAVLVDRFRAAVDRWGAVARQAESQGNQAGDDIDSARSALDGAIDAIRALPGFESFLGYPTIDDIRAAAVEPLVYLVAARLGGVALIVPPDGSAIECVWLRRLTERRVRAQAEAYVAAYRGRRLAPDGWVAAIDELGGWLWEVAMRTVAARLGTSRFVVVPTGLLGLLPLHAAFATDAGKPDGRRYVIDDAVISFASTAEALLAGRQVVEQADPAAVLAVQNPEPVYLPPLPNAEGEIAAVAAVFEQSMHLAAREATVENIVPAMAEYPVLHFACHALSSIEDPSRSGIVVSFDRLLDPRGLATLRLGQTRLVVLSACESGVYGGQVPDEAIGLPNAFVEAGAAGVIASLWEVADASAMILVTRFYELWRLEGRDAAEALVEAQRWLRSTTNAEKQAHWLEAWRRGALPEATYEALTTDQLFREQSARDFEHPVQWAAFTFTGAW